jgi:pimeloyl-ACP methyl ester carboxylesterase
LKNKDLFPVQPSLVVLTLPDDLHREMHVPHQQRHLFYLTSFMEDVFAQMGPPRVHVMGHSFGGALALMIAARFPHQVSSFIGVNPVGLQRHPALTLPPRLWKRVYGPLFKTFGHLSAPLIRYAWTQRGIPAMDRISDDDVKKAIYWVGALDFKWQRWAARNIQCPSLILGARNDKVIPSRYAHGLMRGLNKAQPAQLRTRRRGGHTLLIRDPEWVANTLRTFWCHQGFMAEGPF